VSRSLLSALAAGVLLAVTTACASARPAATALPAAPAPQPSAEASVATAGTVAEEDLGYLRLRMLMVPVKGVSPSKVPDSFNARRGSSRRHNACDILAPRGTPVLSADDGRVFRLRRNSLGGIVVYAIDPGERFIYYYAHLDHYREGLKEGPPLAKGEVIGYVGTTGNAPPDTPHLHFQVMRMTSERKYWDGVPVDPKPFFALDGTPVTSEGTPAATAASSAAGSTSREP
jgi:murein DD-endopeptidase MepM/ murein hydrolase activator NlpD